MGHHAFIRKPLATILEHDRQDYGDGKVCHTFGLFGLSCIGMAATIGSGVFVLSGTIAHEIAGSAGVISWVLAGLCCVICGVSYVELSIRIPASGGPYPFVYNIMGEVFAVMICWLISLEFGISGAAVSRAWSDKVVKIYSDVSLTDKDPPQYTSNVLSAALMAMCVLITASGMELSKEVVSFFVVLKIGLLVFMIVAAFTTWNSENLQPFAPYGTTGVLRGTTSAFFAYVGFDESCVFAAEAINASRDVPLSMVITILVSTSLCTLSSLSLSGAVPYTEISPTSAFVDALHDNGLSWAGHIAEIGELIVIPSVALASFMAQPKILYSLARDGLLPSSLASCGKFVGLDAASLFCGLVCVVFSAILPFEIITNLISAGILLAYTFAHTCYIILRVSETSMAPSMTNGETKFWKFFGMGPALGLFFIMKSFEHQMYSIWFPVMCSFGGAFMFVYFLAAVSIVRCNPTAPTDDKQNSFVVPQWCFPWLPAIGTVLNWSLIAQLDWPSLGGFAAYVTAGLLHYWFYGHSHSVGYLKNWNIISPSVSTVDSEIRYPGFDANEDGLREDTNATLELPLKSQNSRVGLPQLRLDESLRSQKSRSKSISNWSEVEQSNTSRKPRTVSLSKGSKDL